MIAARVSRTPFGLIACLVVAGLAAIAAPADAEGSALHRRMDAARVQCDHCHSTESWTYDFARAQAATAHAPFEHGWTGFPLSGKHAQIACLQCHAQELRPARACRGCHEDEHAGRLGQDCDRCHVASGWNELSGFVAHRDARLPLSGMHALIECSACHTRGTVEKSDAPPSECFACHRDDYALHTNHPRHTADPRDPKHAAFSTDCRQCHNTLGWSPARLPRELAALDGVGSTSAALASFGSRMKSRREHSRFFPIASGAHASAECGDCHRDESATALSCAGCHAHSEPALRRQHDKLALPASRSAAICLSCHVRGARR